MTKTEIMENYTAEQLAGMVINLQGASEVKNDEIHKLKWKISSLEEENGRLQSELDTYNNYLLPKATKEAKEMIDHNHFTGVRIVTWEQWNNRRKADGRVCFPKEYEQTVKEFLNIDTSEIQEDCHRFGIESLQRYLKNPVPIKIPKRDDKNMNISDIQKCQDEYEKILKESPLEGVMNKITKDIFEQKNNAMAMEFTRIICDLLKRYGVYVHCTEIKLSENITHNSIEEQYGIVFDSMDFSQHNKEFTEEIERLQNEYAEALKRLEERQARIKELEAKQYDGMLFISIDGKPKTYTEEELCKMAEIYEETKRRNEYDRNNLYPSDSLMIQTLNNAVNELKSEVKKYRKAFECAKKERDCQIMEYRKKIKEMADRTILEFPTEPIDVANFLINGLGASWHYDSFDVSELRQIAEHLLVYCKHNGELEE